MEHLHNDCLRFGVSITRVEIQNLLMNAVMTDAMTKQLIAERRRRSIVLLADGKRQQMVLQSVAQATVQIIDAEAEKAVQIANSSADAKVRSLIAQADSDAIVFVKNALAEQKSKYRGVDYMLQMRYLGELAMQSKFTEVRLVEEDVMNRFK
jgi:regulator of protease activity HflC (stomatin/prohibitin superfamily)